MVLMLLTGWGWANFPSEPSLVLTSSGKPLFVATGDLNGDNFPDLAVSFEDAGGSGGTAPAKNSLRIYYQKGGGYTNPFDKEIAIAGAHRIKIGDYDDDGKNDLAVTSAKRLHLFLGREGLALDHQFYDVNQYETTLGTGKISKSGISDFLVGPVWRKWSGGDRMQDGYFSGPKRNDNGMGVLADLNFDGVNDVIFATRIIDARPVHAVRIYYGPFIVMNVQAQDALKLVELPAPAHLVQVGVGDLNGDEREDIIISCSGTNGNIGIYYQAAPMGFADRTGPSAIIEGTAGMNFTTADVNNDGLMDLIVADRKQSISKIHIFLQKKGKPFAGTKSASDKVVEVKATPAGWCIDDLNGDGFPDILSGSASGADSGVIAVFLNDRSWPEVQSPK